MKTNMNMSEKSLNKCMWAFILTLFLASLAGMGRAADDKGYGGYKGPVAPFMQVISTNAVCVLPDRSRMSAPAFAAGTTYAQGAMVESRGLWYMCVNGGTAGTNSPHHSSGEASDGTNTWRQIPSGPRKGWVITNMGTNVVRIGYGTVPTALTGVPLSEATTTSPGGTWYEDAGNSQGKVFVIGTGTATNGLVSGQEL
jgi:hypothetical protein